MLLRVHNGYDQQKFTYGLEIGIGNSQVYFKDLYASSAVSLEDRNQVGYTSSEYNENEVAASGGGYARYQLTPSWYIQSGLNYAVDAGTCSFYSETTNWSEYGNAKGTTRSLEHAHYRLHQVELPLLLGWRFEQRWRIYAGPTWGRILATDTRMPDPSGPNSSLPYRGATTQLSFSPSLLNMRAGIGVDFKHLSLNATWHQTLHNASRWERSTELSEGFGTEQVTAGGSNMRLERIMLTLGYRLW